MRSSPSPKQPSSLEPSVSSSSLLFYLFYFLLYYRNRSSRNLTLENGLFSSSFLKCLFGYLRVAYNVPEDVDIAYCHEGDIDIQRHRGVNIIFFPLMAILEGGIRFPIDPLIIGTLRFYSLCPDQLPSNFY